MVYAFIVIILMLALAPLVSALPSKSQREKIALRDRARDLDLRVSIRRLPEPPPRFKFRSERELICYSRSVKRDIVETRRLLFVQMEGVWRQSEELDEPMHWLDELPPGVLLVTVSTCEIDFFWNEEGGVEALKKIAQAADSMLQIKINKKLN